MGKSLEKELIEIGRDGWDAGFEETGSRSQGLIVALARMLAHVMKKPTPKKKVDLPKLAMSPQDFIAWIEATTATAKVVSSSGHQWGWLGRKMREAAFKDSEDIGCFADYVAREQYPWYEENGHAFTMSTVLKNFNRWLEQYRAGPVKSTRKQEELRIK